MPTLQALSTRLGPHLPAFLALAHSTLDERDPIALLDSLGTLLSTPGEPPLAFVSYTPPPASDGASNSASNSASSGALRGAPQRARYTPRRVLGVGGMGEVNAVQDTQIHRPIARKVMKPGGDPARFLREAHITARLQHPGIVPVHEIGWTEAEAPEERRPYYTMPIVQGETLGHHIQRVHALSTEGRWGFTDDGWSLRRLVDTFHRVCEAVAYAHAKGVVHRDLKPANIMVGAYGEVRVLDWGLAKDLGEQESAEAADAEQAEASEAHATRWGKVMGTAPYMPPEQAAGERDRIGRPSDVYALGAILYQILTGEAPYSGGSSAEVLAAVLEGAPPPLRDRVAERHLQLPDELVLLCEACMQRSPQDRPLDAQAVAREVASWLDGAKRREQALEAVRQAQAMLPEIASLREQAKTLKVEAEAALKPIKPWEHEDIKAPHWAKEDEATALEQKAEILEIQRLQTLRSALNHVPDLAEAHEALAEHYQEEHEEAEAERSWDTAEKAEVLLRTHDRSERFAAYLTGTGAVTLVTDPPGAEVHLYRYVTHNRRLVEKFERVMGRTPLVEEPLERGSYLMILKKEGHEDVRYPVYIDRGRHWDGVPPEGNEPQAIRLPREAELAPDDRYIPAGWFWAGGDAEASFSVARTRLWIDALVMKRFPVTNAQYLVFLNELLAQGREEQALRWVPRERPGTFGQEGAIVYHRDAQGRFLLGKDADGDAWEPEDPVCLVSWYSAVAYGQWAAQRSGRAWRLPGEWEWEKAARGVDGRLFPFGDALDASWCCIRDTHSARALPVPVGRYPLDESPHGVADLAGNMRDWTLALFEASPELASPWASPTQVQQAEALELTSASLQRALHEASGSNRVLRGGSWDALPRRARVAYRSWGQPSVRFDALGFRLSRSLPSAL